MDAEADRGRSWTLLLVAVAAVLVVGVAVVLIVTTHAAQSERPLHERMAVMTGMDAVPAAAPAVQAAPPAPDPAAGAAPLSSDSAIGSPAASVAQQPREAMVSADPAWTAQTAAATGIPERALRAYASAALIVKAEQPSCGLGWNTLAGIGAIESAHGTHSGGALDAAGYPQPAIRGIPLDGSASAAIADTDGGAWDGDATWDRAVGPLQFIPATWQRWGADGNGDGVADPNQIDDAALAAGRYLCAAGEMTSADGWRRAIFSYNHLDSYVDDVAAMANAYAARVAG